MISFKSHSGIHTLTAKQVLPVSVEEVWEFISSPANLSVITPPKMDFRITSERSTNKMYAGQIISYNVSPIEGIRTNWVTEITHVSELSYFVDEQRFGPYTMWHHEHWIRPIAGGTEMIDKISYKVPLGILGNLINEVLIKNKLNHIFQFRSQRLIEIFGIFNKQESGEYIKAS